MSAIFNLIEEPWIPCRALEGSKTMESLNTVLVKAHHIKEIFDSSPLVTGSIYRLLLALLYRTLDGPINFMEWYDLWKKRQFDAVISDKINPYLKKWHDRFYLLHERYPFYQVYDLDVDSATTIAKLAPHLASGNNPTLFDHTLDRVPPKISFAHAAQWLLVHQNYSLGGTVTPYSSNHIKKKQSTKYSKAAPLARAALVIVQGKNLFETLLLNLEQYNSQYSKPYEFDERDVPSWELEDPTTPIERLPLGLVDWLTWQSRSVQLFSEDNSTITKVINMNGYSLPEKVHRRDYERMVAFKRSKGKANDPFPAVGFSEERTIWRDFNALFNTIETSDSPKVLEWTELIYDKLDLGVIPLQLYGAASDQASYHLLRQERFPYHPSILKNEDLRNKLNELLNYAEKGGKALWSAIRTLIIDLTPDLSQKRKFEKNDNERISKLIGATALEQQFWSLLEMPFKKAFQLILTGLNPDADKPWKDQVFHLGLNLLTKFLQNSSFNGRYLRAMCHALAIYNLRFKNA